MYRVFLIDDEPWALISLERLIDWNSLGFEVVRKIENARVAWELIERERPDVVFTDIRMPGMSGLELLGRIHDSSIQAEEPLPTLNKSPIGGRLPVEVVLFSAFADFAYAQEAISKGAFEYLLKPVKRENLDACVRKLAKKLDGNAQSRAREILSSCQTIRETFLALTRVVPDESARMCVVSCSEKADRIVFELLQDICRCCRVEMEHGQTVCICACNDDGNALFQRLEQACAENEIVGGFGMTCEREGLDKFENMYWYARSAMLTAGFIRRGGLLTGGERRNDIHSSALYKAIQYNQKSMIAGCLEELKQQVSAGHLTLDQLFSVLRSIERLYTQEQKTSHFLPDGWKDYSDILNDYQYIDELFDYLNTVLVTDAEYAMGAGDGLRSGPTLRRNSANIKTILSEIDLHYANVQTLDSLSQTLGLSPASLSLLVKKHTGKTYSELLQAKRMEKARELLTYSDLTVAAISEMVGYSDQFYFTKLFKKIYGISPNVFRKQARPVK